MLHAQLNYTGTLKSVADKSVTNKTPDLCDIKFKTDRQIPKVSDGQMPKQFLAVWPLQLLQSLNKNTDMICQKLAELTKLL